MFEIEYSLILEDEINSLYAPRDYLSKLLHRDADSFFIPKRIFDTQERLDKFRELLDRSKRQISVLFLANFRLKNEGDRS